MAVTAIGSSNPTSATARAELVRAQQKLVADMAAKATTRVVAADKAAITQTENEAMQERQAAAATSDYSRLGNAVDVNL